jgi:hypothetical protein
LAFAEASSFQIDGSGEAGGFRSKMSATGPECSEPNSVTGQTRKGLAIGEQKANLLRSWRIRLIAVNRQLIQSDAVITAYGISTFVLREAAGDSPLRQPLRIPAGFLFRDHPFHNVAAAQVCDPAVA